MGRIITKELAEKIARKLGAQMQRSSGPHDLARVWHNGVLVATFGIRRGSSRDQGHDYIPAQIFVNAHFAKLLGQCPKSRADWIAELVKNGRIVPPDPAPGSN